MENTQVNSSSTTIYAPTSRITQASIASIAVLPIVVFYVTLSTQLSNIPYVDDYESVLGFIQNFLQKPTLGTKIAYIFSAQHNEYRLTFENIIFILQYKILGQPNFVLLSIIGNLFVLWIGYLLWRNFLSTEKNQRYKLLSFIPISYLLFQLEYSETLDWSMAGLQNLPVIAFAFLCLMYLSKEGRWNFVLGCLFLALAISASGGGIILCAVGFLLLVEKGKRGESAVWLGVSLFILILYFYHYNFASSQQESHGSLLHSIYHLNALFAFLFLGSAVGSPHSIATMYAAGGLGCVLCAAFLWATKKRYYRKNPTIYYFMVFTIFTAVGVSAIRSGLGYEQAITSHYKIYSDLLIISFYIFILEQYLENRRYATQRFLAVGICGSILFCIACDIYGYKFLKKRRLSLETGVQVYDSSGHSVGPNLLLGTLHEAQSQFSGNQTIRLVIAQAEASGLYRLPRK